MANKLVTLPGTRQAVTLVDREQLRLKAGTKRASLPARLKLGGGIEPPPKSFNWSRYHTLNFPVLGNDNYGDCFYAAPAHQVQLWTGNVGTQETFDVQRLIDRYLEVSGGDNGLSDDQIFPEWARGIVGPDGPHKILDYMLVPPTSAELVNLCLWYFGGVLYTASLLNTWLNNARPGATWDGGGRPDRYAGHAMLLSAVQPNGNLDVETWGFNPPINLTRAGMAASDPEIIAVFSLDWFDANGMTPAGKNYSQTADLWHQLGGKLLPPSPFPPAPRPGPGPGPGPGPAPTPMGLKINLPSMTWVGEMDEPANPDAGGVFNSTGKAKFDGPVTVEWPQAMAVSGFDWNALIQIIIQILPYILALFGQGVSPDEVIRRISAALQASGSPATVKLAK